MLPQEFDLLKHVILSLTQNTVFPVPEHEHLGVPVEKLEDATVSFVRVDYVEYCAVLEPHQFCNLLLADLVHHVSINDVDLYVGSDLSIFFKICISNDSLRVLSASFFIGEMRT